MGLAKTYWLWFFLGGGIVAAGSFAASFAAVRNINNDTLYIAISWGYPIFAIIWQMFTSLAVINASTYNRERGAWGWIASILAALGVLKALYAAAVLFGVLPATWNDFEKGIHIENAGLPIKIDDETTLIRMSTNRSEKSLTYHYKFDFPTLNENTFDTKTAKNIALESCIDFKDILGSPAKIIFIEYEANDGTKVNIKIIPSDCGF